MIIVNGRKYLKRGNPTIIAGGQNFSGVYPFQPETRAIVNRATREGFTLPSLTNLISMDIHINNMKTLGVWDKLDVYYEFAYNNTALSDFSRVNWKNPEAGLVQSIGSNTYTIYGWEGNGIDSYMNTNFTPTTQAVAMQLNNASRNTTTYKATITTNFIDGNSQGIQMRQLNTTQQRINSTGNYTSATGSTTLVGQGLKAINRDAGNAGRLYNKDATGSVVLPTATTLGTVMWLFRSGNSYGDVGVSNYFIGSALSTQEYHYIRQSYAHYIEKIGLDMTPYYEPEVNAAITRANASGFTVPSQYVLCRVNDEILDLKISGVWAKLDNYFKFDYNNTALANWSKINLRNPAGALGSTVGTITYTADGWEGNGIDGYFDTGYIPNGSGGKFFLLNNGGLGATVYKVRTVGNAVITSVTSSSNNWIDNTANTNHKINSANNLNTAADLSGLGMKSLMRDDVTNMRAYNKDVEFVRTQTGGNIASTNQVILKRQSNFSDAGISNFWQGGSLTAAELLIMRNSINKTRKLFGLQQIA